MFPPLIYFLYPTWHMSIGVYRNRMSYVHSTIFVKTLWEVFFLTKHCGNLQLFLVSRQCNDFRYQYLIVEPYEGNNIHIKFPMHAYLLPKNILMTVVFLNCLHLYDIEYIFFIESKKIDKFFIFTSQTYIFYTINCVSLLLTSKESTTLLVKCFSKSQSI